MNLDPHTIQKILQKIYQQMRCPQCGKKVPVDFSALRVVAGNNLILQLQCEDCDTHIVLQASMQGLENVSAPELQQSSNNASTQMNVSPDELEQLRTALKEANGSFESLLQAEESDSSASTDVDSSEPSVFL